MLEFSPNQIVGRPPIAQTPDRPVLSSLPSSSSSSSSYTSSIFDKTSSLSSRSPSPITPPAGHESHTGSYKWKDARFKLFETPTKTARTSKEKHISQPTTPSTGSNKSSSAPLLVNSKAQLFVRESAFDIRKRRQKDNSAGSSHINPYVISDDDDDDDHEEGNAEDGAKNRSFRENKDKVDDELEDKNRIHIPGSFSLSPEPRDIATTSHKISTSRSTLSSSGSKSVQAFAGNTKIEEIEKVPEPDLEDSELNIPQISPGDIEIPDSESQHPQFVPYTGRNKKHRHKSIREINHAIYEKIRNPVKTNGNREFGYTYVLESPSHAPAHVKIGHTVQAPEARLQEWLTCKIPLEEVRSTSPNAHAHYKLIESLVHLELHNSRKSFICSVNHKNHKTHKEWFELSSSVALRSVERWRTWIEVQKPFDENGKLTHYWQWRVKQLEKTLASVDWDVWTHPVSDWQYQLEQVHFYTKHLKPHFQRKDSRFWMVGFGFVVFTRWIYGVLMSGWVIIVLLAL